MDPIELVNATQLHHLRRRVYNFHGVNLVWAWSAPMALAFVVGLAVARLVFTILGIGLGPATVIPFLVLPVGATWAVNREDVHGRSALSIAGAAARFYLTPRLVVVA